MTTGLNERVSAIAPSVTLAMDAKAKDLKAKGMKVFGFAAGEPDFDTPEHIKKAAIKALEAGQTKYTPVAGILELRKAIVEKLEKENGLRYTPEQVVVSNGAKHTLYNVFMALLRDGDEVIIPAPYWLSYPEMVNVAGGKSVFVNCREENDFKLTPAELAKAITPRSKALVLNSPSNPIGVMYTPDELRALAELAASKGLYLVSDEIYEKMTYEGAVFASVGSFSKDIFEKTITVNGFSKAYSMTGWRLGYLAGPKNIVNAVNALQSHSTSGPNTFAQYGAIEALRGSQECVTRMVKAFDERREYIYKRLVGIQGVTCVKPLGAFYVLPNISSFGLDSLAFSEKLLDSQKVVVVPGSAFGADRNVRLSYACSMENIREGLDRLETFAKGL